MKKYHINAKGEAGACSAKKGGCPFGGEDEHFTTPEAARASYEKKQEAAHKEENEKWTDAELKKAIERIPLRGKNLDEIRKNLKEDYERVQHVQNFDAATLADKYGDRNTDYDSDDFYQTIEKQANGDWYTRITVTQYSHQDEPLENIKGLIYHHEQDEYGYSNATDHAYAIKLDQADSERAEDIQLQRDLEKAYKYLNKPEYPAWMVLPNMKHSEPIFDFRANRAAMDANRKVKLATDAIASATKAGGSTSKQAQKLVELNKDKEDLAEALKSASAQRVKKAIANEKAVVDQQISKAQKAHDTAARRSGVDNLKKLQTKLKDAKAEQDAALGPLKAEAEKYAVRLLAIHHPATSPQRAQAQARAWIKKHPELIGSIMKEQTRS